MEYEQVPFIIETAKQITNGTINGKIETRRGDSARIICFDRKDRMGYSHFPIIALIDSGDGEERIYTYTKEGKYHGTGYISDGDLILYIEKDITK